MRVYIKYKQRENKDIIITMRGSEDDHELIENGDGDYMIGELNVRVFAESELKTRWIICAGTGSRYSTRLVLEGNRHV